MRFIFFVLLISLFSQTSFAQNGQTIEGEGRFFFNEEDSLAFLKKQLIFSATQEVVSKELTSMGFDSAFFWDRFEKKFDESFAGVKGDLRNKYGLDKDEFKKLSEGDQKKKQDEFEKELRLLRLEAHSNYGKIASAVKSYTIKKMTRSPQFANARYMTIGASIDRRILNSIYYSFTTDEVKRHYKKLYLTTRFQLNSTGWTELGVDLQKQFVDVVNDHWKTWCAENLSDTVDQVFLATDSENEKLQEYFKLPLEASQSLNLMKSKDSSGKSDGDEFFRDTLWLLIDVSLTKTLEDSAEKVREFNIDGNYVLTDLNTNTLIDSYDFVEEKVKVKTENNQKMSSTLASTIYRMPFEKLSKFSRTVGTTSNLKKMVILELHNVDSINDLLLFQNFLNEKGVTLLFEPQIQKYDGNKGELNLYFQGGTEKLNQLLVSLSGQQVDNTKFIVVNKERPFEFKVKKESSEANQ